MSDHHQMTDLEREAWDMLDRLPESFPSAPCPEEGHLALLLQLAMAGFYYDQAMEDNDQLRLTGDPADVRVAVQHDLSKRGPGLSVNGFLLFRDRFPDWQDKVREIIDRLNELVPTEPGKETGADHISRHAQPSEILPTSSGLSRVKETRHGHH